VAVNSEVTAKATTVRTAGRSCSPH